MNMKGRLTKLVPLLALTLAVSACSFGAGGGEERSSEPSVVKIMSYNEQSFYQQYGMLFAALHPDIEVEVAAMDQLYRDQNDDRPMSERMLDFIEEQQPDVLMLSSDEYADFARDGRLYDLSPIIEDEDFDVDGIMPGLIDYLKNLSNGELYGLAPTFYSQAVFYNRDLFEKHGVPLPTDQMSWDDILGLAMRFPTDGSDEERVYGLRAGYRSSVFQLGNAIGATQGLSVLDPEQMKVTINTDSWKAAFETALQAIESGAIYVEDPNNSFSGGTYEEYLKSDPFISGRLAMTIDGSYYINQLREAATYLNGEGVENWDLVTVPVDPNNPDVSTNVSVSQIYAINANSPNVEAAQAFIRYIHSDEYARVSSKTMGNGDFPIRTEYMTDEDGRNVQAFAKLGPSSVDLFRDYEDIPPEFFMQFDGLAEQELQGVTEGRTTLDDALNSLQAKLDAALLQALQNQEAAGGETSDSASASDSGQAAAEATVEVSESSTTE